MSGRFLVSKRPHPKGVRYEYRFPNGYGASVIHYTEPRSGKRVYDVMGLMPDGFTPFVDTCNSYLDDFGVSRLLNVMEGL